MTAQEFCRDALEQMAQEGIDVATAVDRAQAAALAATEPGSGWHTVWITAGDEGVAARVDGAEVFRDDTVSTELERALAVHANRGTAP